MSTTLHAPAQQTRRWLLVDAKGQILGRLASRIAMVLRGKHKAAFTPYIDTGDFVVVINAAEIAVTGRKLSQKLYRRYTGYPSGHREVLLEEQLRRHPDRVITKAVKGMLPEGPLARRMLTKLKVYPGAEHPHAAQRPMSWEEGAKGVRHGVR